MSSLWLSCDVCFCSVGTLLLWLLVYVNYSIVVCILIFKTIDPFGTTNEPLPSIVSDTVDGVVSVETCLSVVLCGVFYCI